MEETKYILVVDDNRENLKVVSSFLKEKQYKIALALSGEDAMKILSTTKIDLILLDIMMPEMDGFETCKLIKQDEKLKDIPVIFLSAKDQTSDIVDGFDAGGVDYITKPFQRDELFVRVNNHLELAYAKTKIVEMNRTRDKLYSIIAHDIRSPFSSIMQMMAFVNKGHISAGSPEFQEILSLITKRTEETSNLLNNLLEWTKVQSESIQLKIESINLLRLIFECIQLQKGNAHQKEIEVICNVKTDVIAKCDEVTVHTIFRNLISNAIKFTEEKGTIIIDSECDEQMVHIYVKDTGIGIDEKVLNQIMQHNQVYTSKGTNQENGSGLGLVMVKDFVAKNKGILKIESKTGKGTAITVSLPRS